MLHFRISGLGGGRVLKVRRSSRRIQCTLDKLSCRLCLSPRLTGFKEHWSKGILIKN